MNMSNDIDPDKEGLEEAIKDVTSLQYYLKSTLPYAERKLSDLVQNLKGGVKLTEKDLVMAILQRARGRNALDRYQDSSEVKECVTRIERLYKELAGTYKTLPE